MIHKLDKAPHIRPILPLTCSCGEVFDMRPEEMRGFAAIIRAETHVEVANKAEFNRAAVELANRLMVNQHGDPMETCTECDAREPDDHDADCPVGIILELAKELGVTT